MSYVDHIELDEIIERYKVFLSKLEQRALELKSDTINAAQEVTNQDEIRFHHFKNGITGQYQSLVNKAREIFKDQIKKKSNHNYLDNSVIFSDKNLLAFEQKITNANLLLENFEERINDIITDIFNQVKTESPQQKFDKIVNEYQILEDNFNCSQCGAKLTIDQMYFVSTYIKCDYCQTQNTFIPSMKMALIPDLVSEIAVSETGLLDYPITGKNLFEQFCLIEEQSRKQYFIKKQYLPQLEKSYLDIYKRELSDFMLNEFFSDDENQQLIHLFKTKYQSNEGLDEKNNLENFKQNIFLNIELLNMPFVNESIQKENVLKDLDEKISQINNQINNKQP